MDRLGADGAACSNNLDMFQEMRIAALVQKVQHGPTTLPAREAFRLATMGGAEVMRLEKEIGSLEDGKRADILVLDRELNVQRVFIDGEELELR